MCPSFLMAGVFTIPKLVAHPKNLSANIPTFEWSEFTCNEVLGVGSFGDVYCGCYEKQNDLVTVKLLPGENREIKCLFFKGSSAPAQHKGPHKHCFILGVLR